MPPLILLVPTLPIPITWEVPTLPQLIYHLHPLTFLPIYLMVHLLFTTLTLTLTPAPTISFIPLLLILLILNQVFI